MNKILSTLLLVISIPAFAQTAQYYGKDYQPAGSSITSINEITGAGVTQYYSRDYQPAGQQIFILPTPSAWQELGNSTPTPNQPSPADTFYKAMGR